MTKVKGDSTAFILVDAQNFVLHENGFGIDWGVWKFAQEKDMIRRTAKAIEKFRAAKMPIIFVEMDLRPQIAGALNRNLSAVDFWKPLREMDLTEMTPEEGEFQGRVIDEFTPHLEDIRVTKYHTMSGFHNTDLDRILRALNCDTLLFAGAVTNLCVESTVRSAFDRGYNCVVLSDCVAARNDDEQNFALNVIYPIMGQVCSSAELEIMG
ncbi:cysteine hydrolase [Methanolobus profundi]|uniref:Nicotinamidase-related amidase n=1 Tax=Methanolobus profundi TaxID=487685 RepID=A0A1I4PRG5_9EURY|nr:cysteine hydrolase [Methanolobus profundi]SFM30080.1 Nicotinamidase-related amidase [Methanolobus profundi]